MTDTQAARTLARMKAVYAPLAYDPTIDVTIQDVYEAVGAHAAGKISDEDLREMECSACPSAGSSGL